MRWTAACNGWLVLYGLGFSFVVTGITGLLRIWAGSPAVRPGDWPIYAIIAVAGVVAELFAQARLEREVNRTR